MNSGPMTDLTIGVFGATGQTGRHVVRNALEQGHRVQALARDPSRLDVEDANLTVIEGDFEDDRALSETIRGATHVICCAGRTYGKGYNKGMMTRFIAKLWPMLDAEASLKTFLFQSVFFVPEPDGSNPLILKLLAPTATYFTGATEMLKDNLSVTKFIAAHRSDRFDYIITRPGKIVAKDGGSPLVASRTPSFAAITFAQLGVFTVGAVQDVSLHGAYPFVAPEQES